MSNMRTLLHNNRQKKSGAALMIFVILFMVGSLILTLGIGRTVYTDLVRYHTLVRSKESYFASQSGAEDVIYRLRNTLTVNSPEVLTLGGAVATTTVDLVANIFEITTEAVETESVRVSYIELLSGNGASFNYGIQTGNGGFSMSNNSSVIGNVFSNGTVVGQGSATVYGDVISAGPGGLLDGVTATGTVYAHTITDSTIGGDAFYQLIDTDTTVAGTKYPSYPDIDPEPLPVSDAMVADWQQELVDSGSVIAATDPECSSGTYVIDTAVTIGNLIIECNLVIDKKGSGTTVTLDGNIWVQGNLSFTQGPRLEVDASLDNESVYVIVDNPADTETSSQVNIGQSTEFAGSGNPSSFIMLLSQNDSWENGGSEYAIDIGNSSNGKVILYASHGAINIGNSTALKEVTAYRVVISNGAAVTYESGLANLLFTGGPGGGFTVQDWREVE